MQITTIKNSPNQKRLLKPLSSGTECNVMFVIRQLQNTFHGFLVFPVALPRCIVSTSGCGTTSGHPWSGPWFLPTTGYLGCWIKERFRNGEDRLPNKLRRDISQQMERCDLLAQFVWKHLRNLFWISSTVSEKKKPALICLCRKPFHVLANGSIVWFQKIHEVRLFLIFLILNGSNLGSIQQNLQRKSFSSYPWWRSTPNTWTSQLLD